MRILTSSLLGILIAAVSPFLNANSARAEEQIVLNPSPQDTLPILGSTGMIEKGVETLTVRLKNGETTIVPVPLENDVPLDISKRQYGKGKQLEKDAKDFPELAKTGLHNEDQLRKTKTITGKPVDEITKIGRPNQASSAGFIDEDEDILSVLIGDNRLVRSMGLTHPELAKPLFHILNLVLDEYQRKGPQRFILSDVEAILYNYEEIHFKGEGSKGSQESIFNDEIRGNAQFNITRDLKEEEQAFLKKKYARLNTLEFDKMVKKLTLIHTGEMEPYYIMRYGFYEGHTYFRADPIAIAFVFGLLSIEEIENAFPGCLYEALTEHFTPKTVQ